MLLGQCAYGETICRTAYEEEPSSESHFENENVHLNGFYLAENYNQNFTLENFVSYQTYPCYYRFTLLGSIGSRGRRTLHARRCVGVHRWWHGKPPDVLRKPADVFGEPADVFHRKPAARQPAIFHARMPDPGDDKRPPSWKGTRGRVTQELYIRYAEDYIRGLSDLDRDRGCVRLW